MVRKGVLMGSMTTKDEVSLINCISAYRPGRRMNDVPGMPVSHVPLCETAALRTLINKGLVKVVMKGERAYLKIVVVA